MQRCVEKGQMWEVGRTCIKPWFGNVRVRVRVLGNMVRPGRGLESCAWPQAVSDFLPLQVILILNTKVMEAMERRGRSERRKNRGMSA